MHNNRSPRNGFTLIELLVVIAIIGILIAILVPGAAAVKKAARIAQAKHIVQSLDLAIKAYYQEYGKLPIKSEFQGGGDKEMRPSGPSPLKPTSDYTLLIQALTAMEAGASASKLNPKSIVFLDGVNEGAKGVYVDPWDNSLLVKLDASYDNKMQVYNIVTPGQPLDIATIVAVSSAGPDGKLDTTDDLTSYSR